ncbi:MAG: hypothetical protein HY435_02365 [Candidatus Liptonbacteria bacterium]|nr:hypothetical protein [Candidatus Liptonbacteria bacterium]
MTHRCTTLLLHCIDFRFGKAIEKFLEKNRLSGSCDIVAAAGAAKNLAAPQKKTDKEFILRQIEISKKLHEIKKVILMNHADCGAYGGRKAFQSDKEEFERHAGDMREAKAILMAHHPSIMVETVFAKISHSGGIRFEETK